MFPAMKKFLNDYLKSLEKQTDKNFDLIIVNDGLSGFGRSAKRYRLNNIQEIKGGGSIAKNRELGINYVKNKGYDYLIFTDSDDFFAHNRVKKSVELLKYYDIVVNDLTTVSAKGKTLNKLYFSKRLKNLFKIRCDFIKDKNIFGLSNTAIRVGCLERKTNFQNDLIAVDWNLFYGLLKNGCSAIFSNETETFYRIYKGNTVGLSPVSKKNISQRAAAKFRHYLILSQSDKSYKSLAIGFGELIKKMNNKNFKNKYLNKIKSSCINKPFWWEEVKLLKI